ncbi:hypothetical protein ACHAXT_006787 [Thalassiosira profunda]
MGATATASDDGPTINLNEEDKRIKKDLLLETIASKCASSSHDMMRKIHHAINEAGDASKLEAAILSGGYTNYSYRVFVDKHPELVIFAKFCFDFAMWNPDPDAYHDLKRTDNEYKIMKKVSAHAPDCVVAPIALWDLKQDGQQMKLLVTEWSKGDEQFCNQFIDGTVDPRIAPKIASTLATLHNIEGFDPDFNAQVNDCVWNMFEQMKEGARERCNVQSPKDRTEAYCASLDEEALLGTIDAMVENCAQGDCLIHSDAHVFNTLVEGKPSVDDLDTFGPEGTLVLCDWEMAYVGPIGKDIGWALSFPIACMVAHALNGHMDTKDSILAHNNSLLDSYIFKMIESGNSKEEMAGVLRNIFGYIGLFHYQIFYVMQCQIDSVPVENDEQATYVRDAMGTLGLKLIRLGFEANFVSESATLEDVRSIYDSLWEEEMTRASEVFASKRQKQQPRKSSVLRAANRRISDAMLMTVESVKRHSTAGGVVESTCRLSTSEAVGEYFAFREQ